MPELIHSFIKGKMNKDLDERLVPNGEYRDALNLEVTTSDGSDVGSLQTLHGNSQRINRTYNTVTQTHETWSDSGLVYILDTATCVGVKKDPTTEKIYWFITDKTQGVSAIAEYDQVQDVVYPILVDKQNILNFSKDYLITGINILEGFLFWTDNQTEPKKIEISKFKEGSVDFDTHTQIYGADFTEEYITVIKKYPLLSPTIYKKNSVRDGDIDTITSFEFSTVVDSESTPLDFGTIVDLVMFDEVDYLPGDFLLLKETGDEYDSFKSEYQVRVKVEEVIDLFTFRCSVQRVGESVTTGIVAWEVELEQDDPLFEFKFPRFAFRYKYDDNQFSSFSPFSQIAFIPGEDFEYSGVEGYNLSMTNNVRVLEVRDFVPNGIPDDVIAVDILYKETSSTNVYRVDTIERDSDQWNDVSYYEPGDTQIGSGRLKIETELISSLLPANQLLRPYDNVPKVALAQEIIGNRLIYGNYLQNFNMFDIGGNEVIPNFNFSIIHDPTKNEDIVLNENLQSNPIAGVAIPSLKSMRTYQMGVVYLDEYGRQSPVFTNDSGSRDLAKEFADLYNTISIRLTNNPPKWASYYKYYVKETSNQYYNLALDRFYITDSDDVWLSFASADRNKVDEETFLELKKRHDSDIFVSDKARYKILAVENEAPDALKINRILLGTITENFQAHQSDAPGSDKLFFNSKNYDDVFDEENGPSTKSNIACSISSLNGGNVSKIVAVTNISQLGGEHDFRLDTIFGNTLDWYDSSVPQDIKINIYQEEQKNKPEFEGRFFVKIYKDLALAENLLNLDDLSSYVSVAAADPSYIDGTGESSWWKNGGDNRLSKKWFWDEVNPNDVKPTAGNDIKYQNGNLADVNRIGTGVNVGEQQLALSFHGFGNPWEQAGAFYRRKSVWWNWPSNEPTDQDEINFVNKLESVGSKFRFPGDPDDNIYEITQVYRSAYTVDNRKTGRSGSGRFGSQRVVRFNITIDKPIAWLPAVYSTPVVVSSFGASAGEDSVRASIEFVEVYFDPDDTFTSRNPAIFETYPKEAVDLDLYHSASDIFQINNPGTSQASHQPLTNLPWFNCYSFGQGVESNRIRDDYNQPIIDKGPVVSTVLDETYAEELRPTSLIFSQIFNSTSGVNRLNQFIAAEPITKDLNPYYTSIQKLHARDTDLVTLCEDKILKVLANKDALYNADGSTNIVGNQAVLGQSIPFIGEYGISKNPESFASYGFRAYFTDKNRGVVLRLSRGGLEEISAANMTDFFSNNLNASKHLLGSYDDDKNVYNLTLDSLTNEWQLKLDLNKANPTLSQTGTTVSFSEDVGGWTSRKDFIPESAVSLNNKYYSLNKGKIWEHGNETVPRNNFYGVQYDSAIRLLINEAPNSVKKFKTLNYSGTESKEYLYSESAVGQDPGRLYSLAEVQSNPALNIQTEVTTKGWYSNKISTNLQDGYVKEFLDKEGKYFNYIKGEQTTLSNLDSKEFSVQGLGMPSNIIADPRSFILTLKMCSETGVVSTIKTYALTSGSSLSDLNPDPGAIPPEVNDNIINISPSTGYNINQGGIAGTSTPSQIDSVSYVQNGDDIVASILWDATATMPSNDLTVTFCPTGKFIFEETFSLDSILRITETGEVTPSSQDITLTPVSGVVGSSTLVHTQVIQITPANISDYYFEETPFIFVNNGDASNYTFASSGLVYTNGLLTSITFTITYQFPSVNVTTDVIEIVANSVAVGTPIVLPISYSIAKTDISCSGETRSLTVNGTPGTQLTVEALSDDPSYVPQFQVNDGVGNENQWTLDILASGSIANNIIFAGQVPIDDSNVVFTFNFLDAPAGNLLSLNQANPLIKYQTCSVTNLPPEPSQISTNSDVLDACPLTLDDTCYIETATPGQVSVGDVVYTNAAGTTVFVGNGNYYHLKIDTAGFTYSAQINSSGVVLSPIALCI